MSNDVNDGVNDGASDGVKNKTKAPKKPKKKGPIRFEAIIPFTIVIALIVLYCTLFLDGHIRRLIEIAGTYGNGAEVNLAEFDLSFTGASISLKGLQVTNANSPDKNLVAIGEMKFQFLWDALLRAKLVIEDAVISDVFVNSKRERPGRVIPPEVTSGPPLLTSIGQKTMDKVREQYDDSILGDVSALLGGVKPEEQLKKLEGALVSKQEIERFQKEIQTKREEWEARIKDLPTPESAKELEARFKSVKKDGFKNAQELQASISEIDSIIKDVRERFKNVDSASSQFSKDMANYTQTFKSFEKLIQKDINDLQAKFNIPSLDASSISSSMFADLVLSRLDNVRKMAATAMEYMPPNLKKGAKKEEESRVTPKERQLGENYSFARAGGYPLFWLKKGVIQSALGQSKEAGEVNGTFANFTSDPPHLGVPATIDFTGNFPQQEVFDVLGKMVFDHTTEVAKQSLQLSVGRHPIGKTVLSESSDVTLGFLSALANSQLNARLEGESILFELEGLFKNLDYFLETEDSKLKEILGRVLADLQSLNLRAKIEGSWRDFSLSLRSNLGEALQNALKKELDLQIQQARQQLEAHVRSQIAGVEKEAQKMLTDLEKQLGVPLRDTQQAFAAAEKRLEDEKKKITKQQQKKLEKEGQKVLKDLQKQLGF